ncbi:MAG: 2-dehydro-3-deoxyphosphooctonate aldolase [Phycisphaerae bacterium]|nr:MAG: 2-dehydro-3-deoxyphosphooctonate aldolase [Phycisphaerae bacterium]
MTNALAIKCAQIDKVKIGAGQPLAIIAGPCVIESRDHTLKMADAIAPICRRLNVPLVFKASFDKANRTSANAYRGPGLEKALDIFAAIGREMGLPVTTDVHLPEQVGPLAPVIDCLQIPAFLCRQTDLLVAAANTGRCVNVKKGQFMAPDQMAPAIKKIIATGNDNALLTERGTFFGYGRLVNDMTAIPQLKEIAPIVFDATHSCQHPGAGGDKTGGNRQYIKTLALSAIAAGADALFLEVHDDPDSAMSDAATQLPLDLFESLVQDCVRLREALP